MATEQQQQQQQQQQHEQSFEPTIDPVLFFGRKLKYHFEKQDILQIPFRLRGKEKRNANRRSIRAGQGGATCSTVNETTFSAEEACRFDLNWENACTINNAWLLGEEGYNVSTRFVLEHKFLALSPHLLYAYIYLELNHQFFSKIVEEKTAPKRETLEQLLEPIFLLPSESSSLPSGGQVAVKDKRIDYQLLVNKLDLLADLYVMSKSFTLTKNTYTIVIAQMSFAWNDAAIPCMRKEQRSRTRKFSETGFNIRRALCGWNQSGQSSGATAAAAAAATRTSTTKRRLEEEVEEQEEEEEEEQEEAVGEVDDDLINKVIVEAFNEKHRFQAITLYDVVDKRYIEDLARRFSTVITHQQERSSGKQRPQILTTALRLDHLTDLQFGGSKEKKEALKAADEVLNHFLNQTSNDGVTINGTACVGKTTLLRKVLKEINESLDKNAKIHKASDFGGFSGKDTEQLLALQYQLCTVGIAKLQYTSIFDRGIYNNMIWRLVLALLNTNDELVATSVKLFGMISPLTIELMKKQPTIILIDSNVYRNRRNMVMRNEGGDYQRSQIERYVVAQNLVYGVFASLCNWPLVDLADFGSTTAWDGRLLPTYVIDKLQNLVILKIKSNIERNGNKLPSPEPLGSASWLLTRPHRFKSEPSYTRETPIDYSVARYVEIFK